jgi:O-antigen ligase
LAIVSVLLLIFVTFIRPQEFIPELEAYGLVTNITVLGLIGVLVDIGRGKIRWVKTPQNLIVLLFVTWCALTLAVNTSIGDVFPELKANILFPAITMFVIANAGSSLSRFRALALAMMAVAVFLAAACIHQGTRDFECIELAKEEGVIGSDESIGTPDGRECEKPSQCRDENAKDDVDYMCERPGIFGTFTVAHGRVRWRGKLADPNELSLAIGAAMAFAFGVYATWKSGIKNAVFAIVVVSVAYCIILSGSRGGTLVAAMVPGSYLIRKYRWKGIALAVIAGAPVIMLGGRSGEDADGSTQERIEALGEGIEFFKQSPIFGLGQGQFANNYYITAHNSYLLSAAELGFPGFLIWSCLLYVSVKIAYLVTKAEKLDPELVAWARALLAGICGVLVGIFFLSFSYHIVLFIWLGLVGALYGAARAQDPGFEVKLARSEIAIVGCIDVTFLLLLGLYTRLKGV